MYIITVRRITSGELLKYRKGFCIDASYGMQRPGSSRFSLTMPLVGLGRHFRDQREAVVFFSDANNINDDFVAVINDLLPPIQRQ